MGRFARTSTLVLGAALALGGCKKDTEEQKVLRVIDDGVAAIEAGQVGDAMDLVADDFSDENGTDKGMIKGYLAGQMLRGDRITIVRRDENVKVDGTAATASFDAAIFQGDRAKLKGVVPQRSGTYRFTLTFRKDDGDWLVTKATWKNISAGSFLVDSIGD